METIFKGIFVALFAMAVLSIVGLVAAVPLMLLWNWLMPAVFGLKVITYSQAWGIFWLSGFLFKTAGSSSPSKSKDGQGAR